MNIYDYANNAKIHMSMTMIPSTAKIYVSLPKTLNKFWAAATAVCLWFLFIHTPAFLAAKYNSIRPVLAVHLLGVFSIYLICVLNTLLTPSTFHGAAKPFHIWAGRIGYILGPVGFVSGIVLTWFIANFRENWIMSIAITYGGIRQMQGQLAGFRAIRRYSKIKAQIAAREYNGKDELRALQGEADASLTIHIQAMVEMFVMACGTPAYIRLSGLIDGMSYSFPVLFMIAGHVCKGMSDQFTQKIKARHLLREQKKTKLKLGTT